LSCASANSCCNVSIPVVPACPDPDSLRRPHRRPYGALTVDLTWSTRWPVSIPAGMGRAGRRSARCCPTRSSNALHETGCASAATGWRPRFIVCKEGASWSPRCPCT
jgi:hypothetical protein